MENQEMIEQYENDLLSKVMGFCYMKLTNREDAEDLASDISVEVLKTIHSGKHIENLNALVWSISNHMFCKRLRSKKYSNTVYLDELYPAEDDPEKECILKEQLSILHREIALLSENYRRSVVLYYFENRNCDEIALALHKSPGTIKWWLHEARKQMKEGFNIMREYGEKSFNPGKLCMSCQGLPGADNEPMSLAKRKLPQNILLAAYKEAMTVQELCAELGTPAAYVEDELSALVEGGLMQALAGGKYQTDFVILPGNNTKMADKIYEECFPDYFTLLMDFLERHKSVLTDSRFNTASFSWDRLLWVYIHIFTDIMLSKYKHEECDFVTYQNIPMRPNGGKWIALGYNNGWFSDASVNSSSRKEYAPFDGPVHKMGKEFAQGYFHYWSGLDSNVFFDIPEGVFALCRDIIKGKISIENMNDDQKYLLGIAISKKLFIGTDDGFKQNYYYVDYAERVKIEELSLELYDTVKAFFDKAYRLVLNEYRQTVPKHLHWQMGNFLSNHLGNFVTCSLYEGVKNKMLSEPDEQNREWLSLFASDM